MHRRTLLRAVGGVVGLSAVGGSATAAGTYTEERYEGRTYWKYVPSGADGSSEIPLLVMLHGCGQSPDQFRYETGMNAVAEEETFAVIYPDQTPEANADECWNWFQNAHTTRGSGEAALITGMARQVVAEHAINPNRVYVAGLSAGAAMVPNLLAAYPDVYAAGGIHSGLEYDAADNVVEGVAAMATGGPDPQAKGTAAYEAMAAHDVTSAVPTIVVHGTDDLVVAPVNGHQAAEQATQTNDLASDGTDDDGVDYAADATYDGQAETYSYTVSEYHGERNGPVVEKWMVHGMGHGWSGGAADGEDTQPGGPDASRFIWDFLRRHTRPR